MIDFLKVRPGDRVTIRTPQGQECTGKVVMTFPAHCVMNMGGRHGRPGVATATNVVKHSPRKP